MGIKKFYSYVIREMDLKFIHKNLDDTYDPATIPSVHFKQWHTNITDTTCSVCLEQDGKIYGLSDKSILKPPVHPRCRCALTPMEAIVAGNATKDGKNGADFWIKYYGKLPDYYISGEKLELLGWKWGKSPKKFAPGKMVTMGISQKR